MSLTLAVFLVAQVAAGPDPSGTDDSRARSMRIGLGELEAVDVSPAVRRVVEEALLVELRKLARTSVVGWAEIRQMLDIEAEKQTLGCGVDGACLAEIADAAGVDVFVAGSLTSTGSESIFTLTRIDQKDARVVGKVQKRLVPERGEEFLAAIGPAVEALFPDVALRSGMKRGVDERLAVRLNPPPLPAVTPWVVGGVSAALLVGGAGTGVFWAVQQADYKALVATPGVAGKSVVDKGNLTVASEITMWSLGALGLLGAGLTAAAIPFTNFDEEAAQ